MFQFELKRNLFLKVKLHLLQIESFDFFYLIRSDTIATGVGVLHRNPCAVP
jgi:hypothetical protein